MDFELFYEEIEGFGLVCFRDLTFEISKSCNKETNHKPHDSVSHQFKSFLSFALAFKKSKTELESF
jgi:hypothetical protein